MAEYIEREAVLELLKDVDRYGYLDASDINSILAADVYTEEDVRAAYTDGYSTGMAQGMEKAAANMPHGWWDDSGRYQFPSGATAIRCSICGCALSESEYRLFNWNYCPVCGAKMDLEGGNK